MRYLWMIVLGACVIEIDDGSYYGEDSDGDGLRDLWETRYGLSPARWDSDENGVPDSYEDWDDDGYFNREEQDAETNPTDRQSYPQAYEETAEPEPPLTPNDPACPCFDADGDGLTAAEEAERGTDPLASDTDGDSENDAAEIDCGSSPVDPYVVCHPCDTESA